MKEAILIITTLLQVANIHAQTMIFSNSNYSEPIPVQSNIDTLIVNNCTFSGFSGEAIRFENVSYVEVKNSTFSNITNTGSTRAIICGKKSDMVVLRNLHFDAIYGTAIRFPTDGASSPLERLTNVIIDSVTINNTTALGAFEANGIRVFLTDTLYISNCTIKKINDNAIAIGRNSSGQTQINQRINYCEIYNNVIDSILGNGILATENAGFARIYRNVITNIAYDGTGMLSTDGDHGIYWQAPGALIYENTIKNVMDGLVNGNTGNGISLRTNAVVYRNEVGNCTRNGISYWNDHPGSGLLEVTNNLVYNTQNNGIYINGSGLNPYKPDTVLLLHNTAHNIYTSGLVQHYSPIALNNLSSYNFVAGNLLIYENVTDTSDYIHFLGTIPSQNISHNYYADLNSGFENIENRDYHLTSTCQAIDFIPPAVTNVLIDKDSIVRSQFLDAGCYEYLMTTGTKTLINYSLRCYPNPGNGIFYFNIPDDAEFLRLKIYDTSGSMIFSSSTINKGVNTIDLSGFINGIYLLIIENEHYNLQTRLVKLH